MAEAHASRDDDALKKNTDCVYFLASPLTCKKVCVHVCCSVCSPSSITCFFPLNLPLRTDHPSFLPLPRFPPSPNGQPRLPVHFLGRKNFRVWCTIELSRLVGFYTELQFKNHVVS
jgi:hypothetical protein